MDDIRLNIHKFGLTEAETLLYLALLEIGSATVLDVARQTGLKRTTAHINLESLIHKGLASEVTKGKRRFITAEPPEKLKYILDQKKFELKKVEDGLDSLIANIYKSIPNVKENTDVEVRQYTGRDSVANLYDEILEAKEVRAYVNHEQISVELPENTDKFLFALERGVQIWDLFVDNDAARAFISIAKRYKNYHYLFFPKNTNFSYMDYLIYENKLALIQGGDNPSGIIIQSDILILNSTLLYKMMWELIASSNNK